MIRIELTNSQFYDMYRNNQFVKGFSFEGCCNILDRIEETCGDSNEIIDWTLYFMNASEHTFESYISEFSTDEHQAQIEEDPEEFDADISAQRRMIIEILDSQDIENYAFLDTSIIIYE